MRPRLTVPIVCCLALTALAPAAGAAAAPDADPELAAALALAKEARTVLDEAISRDPAAPGADPLHRLDQAESVLRERTLDSSGRARRAAAHALIELYETVIERASWPGDAGAGHAAVAERAVPSARALLDLMRDPTLPAELRDLAELTRPARTAVLVLALAEDPRNPGLLAALGEASYDHRLRAALFGAALEAPRLAADHPRLAAWLLGQRLSALLELGLAGQAIAEVARFPAPARELVRHGAVGAVALAAGDLAAQAVQLTLFDLRLELAAAHVLAGEPSAAEGILATLPPRTPTAPELPATGYDPEIEVARAAWLNRETLEHLLAVESGLATADPFGLFLTFLGIDEEGGFGDAVWRRTAARLAEATGYPQIGRGLLTTTCRWLRPDDEGELEHFRRFSELPRAVAAEWDALGGPIGSAIANLLAHIDSLDPGEPWLVSSACPLALPDREDGEESTRALLPPGAEIEPLPGRFSARAVDDRDGDTLSDLEERTIGTDPGRVDSDGDGIPDDRDRLPHSAFGGHAGDVPDEAFALAVERIFFTYGAFEASSSVGEPAGRRLGPEETVFLAVRGGSTNPIDYPPFGRVEAPLRISLVDPAAGDHTPKLIAIEIFELDREGRNAIVVWNEGRGRGWESGEGRFLMTLREDGWAVPIEVRNGGGCVTMRIVELPGDAE